MTTTTAPGPSAARAEPPWSQVIRQLVVLVSVPLCFAFAAGKQDVLPAKYFADSYHIQSLAMAASGPSPDSFITMAWLYRLAGAFDYPTATYLATLGLFFAVVFRSVSWAETGRFGWLQMALFVFCGAEAAIYLAQYSKESVIILLALVLLVAPRRTYGDLMFVVLAGGYAYLIRSYWFIVVGMYLGFRLLLRSRHARWLPIFVACAILVLACAVKLAMGVELNSFRTVVNESNGLYAQSTIKDYLPVSNPLGAAANSLLTLVLLIVPIPLILTLSPTYLAFGAIISLLWLYLLRVVRLGTHQRWFPADVRLSRAVSLLLAMLSVQSIFEPDYGSYIKHLTPLLPLFFFALRALREPPTASRQPDIAGSPMTTPRYPHDQNPPQNTDHTRRGGRESMTLSSTIRTLLRRWYLTLPGIALSCALAGLAFTLVPAQYTSTGLAMVVQPKRAGELKTANPLLSFDTSLNTTAVMLSQSLNTAQSAASLGMSTGPDKYTVKNVGDTNTGGDPNQPFLYVTTQGSTPLASTDLVESVLALASQQLTDQQRSLHVSNQDALSLVTIADASTPKFAPGLSLAAATGALCVGLALTVLAGLALDRRGRIRERSRQMAQRRLVSDPMSALTMQYGQTHLASPNIAPNSPIVHR